MRLVAHIADVHDRHGSHDLWFGRRTCWPLRLRNEILAYLNNVLYFLQVAIAIGACVPQAGARSKTAIAGTSKTPSKMTSSTYQDRPKRNVSSAGGVHKPELGQISRQSSSSSTHGISLKTCLPAYSCLPGILASSTSIRNFLLLPPKHSNPVFKDDGFCLIQFLAKIIEHWASSMGRYIFNYSVYIIDVVNFSKSSFIYNSLFFILLNLSPYS